MGIVKFLFGLLLGSALVMYGSWFALNGQAGPITIGMIGIGAIITIWSLQVIRNGGWRPGARYALDSDRRIKRNPDGTPMLSPGTGIPTWRFVLAGCILLAGIGLFIANVVEGDGTQQDALQFYEDTDEDAQDVELPDRDAPDPADRCTVGKWDEGLDTCVVQSLRSDGLVLGAGDSADLDAMGGPDWDYLQPDLQSDGQSIMVPYGSGAGLLSTDNGSAEWCVAATYGSDRYAIAELAVGDLFCASTSDGHYAGLQVATIEPGAITFAVSVWDT